MVNVKITNTGKVPGAEIVQMYIVSPQEGIHRPIRELRGFKMVWMENSSRLEAFMKHVKGKPVRSEWEAMSGITYISEKLVKGQFTMDNTVEKMKEFSLIMRIMYKAVEKTVAKGFGEKADYENPDFRMMMASSAGSPLRSMQISGGMKGSIMSGLLEMANGQFFRGIGRMIKGDDDA